MANVQEWTVVFYADENGRCPVEEFVESARFPKEVSEDASR